MLFSMLVPCEYDLLYQGNLSLTSKRSPVPKYDMTCHTLSKLNALLCFAFRHKGAQKASQAPSGRQVVRGAATAYSLQPHKRPA